MQVLGHNIETGHKHRQHAVGPIAYKPQVYMFGKREQISSGHASIKFQGTKEIRQCKSVSPIIVNQIKKAEKQNQSKPFQT